jgi:hypothetical protein
MHCTGGHRNQETAGSPQVEVGHPLCPECLQEITSTRAIPLNEAIERLEVPVILVDNDVRVRQANGAARTALKLDTSTAGVPYGGELMRCVNLDEGDCGRTRHCRECILRNTVTAAFSEGKPLFDVPVRQAVYEDGKRIEKHFTISAMPSKGVVLLWMDRFS